jgi:hypothetical protein
MALSHLDFWKIKKYYNVLDGYKSFCIKNTNYEIAANLRDLEVKYFATLIPNEDGTIDRKIRIDRVYKNLDEFDAIKFCEDFINVISKVHLSARNIDVLREINIYLALNDNLYTLESIERLIQETTC